jgi:hypothetical protein
MNPYEKFGSDCDNSLFKQLSFFNPACVTVKAKDCPSPFKRATY